MEFFDLLVILSIVIAAMVVLYIVYAKVMVDKSKHTEDYFDIKKKEIQGMTYNIKKSLINSIEDTEKINTVGNILIKSSKRYRENIFKIEKEVENKKNLEKENKDIEAILLAISKIISVGNKVNILSFKKQLDKLENILG